MMKKEEAIDVIKDVKESFNENSWVFSEEEMDELNESFDAAIEALKATQWIPCSERLPKDDDWQIVTIDETDDTPYSFDFGWYFNGAECWIIDAKPRTDVIAWIPLPPPYNVE